ncbi:hypothetical protein HDU96_000495, partial [Phlyctochytrium bullatum]
MSSTTSAAAPTATGNATTADTDCIVLFRTIDPTFTPTSPNGCCNGNRLVKCDSSNRIIELYLNGTGLQGAFPTSWTSQFTNLQILNLANNTLSGPLPPEIGNFTNLVQLSVFNCSLSGPIPAELGRPPLQRLNLGRNSFSGPIPDALFQPALRGVVFAFNQLTSIPTTIVNSKDLEVLFSGEFPSQLLQLRKLENLYFDNNTFTGPIPDSISDMRALVELSFDGNKFSGDLPKGLFQLTDLTYLSLFDNQFTGSIPSDIGNLVKLVDFGASDNRLEGNLPVEINKLTQLETFYVAGNRLSGQIPKGAFGTQTNLRNLALWQNNLTGPVPDDIYSLSNLVYLDMSLNQLKGPLSPLVTNLKSLERLLLDSNQLYGELPSGLAQMSRLRV